MAQVGAGGRGIAGRLGMRGGRGVAIALAAGLACVGVVLAMVIGRPGGVVVERADAARTVSSATAAAETNETVSAETADKTPARVTVHVDGAVASPGVFEISSESPRVNDAIAAAGGLAEDADTSGINLAAGIADGDKVHVPREGEGTDGGSASSGVGGAVAPPSASGSQSSSGLLNINKASAEELDALPGVGQSTAQAIVEDRSANGPFASVEDLMRVSGIGEKKFEKLKGKICV